MKRATVSVGDIEFEFRHFLHHAGSKIGAVGALLDINKSLLDFIAVRFLKNESCHIDSIKSFIIHVERVFAIREIC